MEDMEFGGQITMDRGQIQANGFGMVQIGPGDDQQLVVFRKDKVHNPSKSRDAGRPIYDAVVMVTINPPGERLNIIDRPVVDSDKVRWPRQWHAFMQNRMYVPEGTEIELLFPANPEISAMLRGLGIHTVELLAKLTPDALDTIGMGSQDWKNRAMKYLEQSKAGAAYHEVEKLRVTHEHETNALKNQIADLTMRLNAMQTSINSLPNAAKMQMERMPAALAAPPVQEPSQWGAPAPGMIADDDDPIEGLDQPIRRPRGRPPKNQET